VFLFLAAEEWEKLYQPEPLAQQIEDTWRAVEQRRQDRIQREKIIIEAMDKMDAQIKQWRTRVSTRNRQAESERLRREQVRALRPTHPPPHPRNYFVLRPWNGKDIKFERKVYKNSTNVPYE
jgi:hypothetical protein